MNKKYTYIDISGIGNSGKTALSDMLREVDGIHVHEGFFEFNLIRFPDGIFDLKWAICDAWSPIRSDIAIKRFKKLCAWNSRNFSGKLLTSNFDKIVDRYINSLVIDTIESQWVDSIYFDNPNLKSNNKSFHRASKMILSSIKLLEIARKLKTKIQKSSGKITKTRNRVNKDIINLVSDDKFIEKTKLFLNAILSDQIDNGIDKIVMHNAFEPNCAEKGLELFDDAFSIIVVRDPRDIYASVLDLNDVYIPNFEKNNKHVSLKDLNNLKKDFLGTHKIESFIERQKLYRDFNFSNKKNIMIISYEELIYDYENIKKCNF